MPDLDELRRALLDGERYCGDEAQVRRVVHERLRYSGADRRGWLRPATAMVAVIAIAFGVALVTTRHTTRSGHPTSSPAPAAAAPTSPHPSAAPTTTRQPNAGPVYSSPPRAPVTGRSYCVVPEYGTGRQPKFPPTGPLLTIGADPTAVIVVWWDGGNQPTPCRTRITHGTAAQAHELAAAIRHAGRSPFTGSAMCPADDGTGAQLFFAYPQAPSEMVSVKSRGCPSVMAPSRAPRAVSPALVRALSRLRAAS